MTRSERPRILQQIILPHAEKAITMLAGDFASVGMKFILPCHQRLVVMPAKVMHVLHDEKTLNRSRDLTNGRQITIWENILILPGVYRRISLIFPNCVKQKQA